MLQRQGQFNGTRALLHDEHKSGNVPHPRHHEQEILGLAHAGNRIWLQFHEHRELKGNGE
jgi:hypothetical protein